MINQISIAKICFAQFSFTVLTEITDNIFRCIQFNLNLFPFFKIITEMNSKAASESSRLQGKEAARRRLFKRSPNLNNSANETSSNNIVESERHSESPPLLSKAFADSGKSTIIQTGFPNNDKLL